MRTARPSFSPASTARSACASPAAAGCRAAAPSSAPARPTSSMSAAIRWACSIWSRALPAPMRWAPLLAGAHEVNGALVGHADAPLLRSAFELRPAPGGPARRGRRCGRLAKRQARSRSIRVFPAPSATLQAVNRRRLGERSPRLQPACRHRASSTCSPARSASPSAAIGLATPTRRHPRGCHRQQSYRCGVRCRLCRSSPFLALVSRHVRRASFARSLARAAYRRIQPLPQR